MPLLLDWLPEDDPWFGALSGEAQGYFRKRARVRTYADRSAVYSIGDPSEGLYRVLEGELRLVSYPTPGRELVNLVLRRGDWFGELSVIDGKPRPHDAICKGPVTLLTLPMAAIEDYARIDAAIYGRIALIGCAHQRTALSFIGNILARPSRARLAELLLAMTGGAPGDGQPATLRIGQAELAAQVGLSRQHLNLLLQELKGAGLIATAYGCIHVLDRVGLHEAAVADML